MEMRNSAKQRPRAAGNGHVFSSNLPLAEKIVAKAGHPGFRRLWEWEKLEPELRKLMKRCRGNFPGKRAFAKLKMDNVLKAELDSGIRHNGGFVEVRNKLGAELPIKRGDESLKHFANLEREIRAEMEKNGGKFPDQNYLVSIKRFDMITAIHRHHGGFDAVRALFDAKRDAKIGEEALVRNRNFFRKLDEVLARNGGAIPCRETLKNQGFGDFVSAVYRSGGTLTKIRKMAGEQPHRKEGKDSLRDWGNMEKEISAMLGAKGMTLVPSAGWEGWQNGYAYLYAAVKRNGGPNKVREKLGPAGLEKTGVSFYKDWEQLQKALLKIVQKQRELPPLEWFMGQQGHYILIQSIYTYHESMWDVRMKLEAEGLTRPIYRHPDSEAHSIKKWENLLPLLKRIISENNGELPGRQILGRQGYYFVMNAIRHNGGFGVVRQKLEEMGILDASSADSQMVEPVVL